VLIPVPADLRERQQRARLPAIGITSGIREDVGRPGSARGWFCRRSGRPLMRTFSAQIDVAACYRLCQRTAAGVAPLSFSSLSSRASPSGERVHGEAAI